MAYNFNDYFTPVDYYSGLDTGATPTQGYSGISDARLNIGGTYYRPTGSGSSLQFSNTDNGINTFYNVTPGSDGTFTLGPQQTAKDYTYWRDPDTITGLGLVAGVVGGGALASSYGAGAGAEGLASTGGTLSGSDAALSMSAGSAMPDMGAAAGAGASAATGTEAGIEIGTGGGTTGGGTGGSTMDGTEWMDSFGNESPALEGSTVDPYGSGSGWGQDTLSSQGVVNDTAAGAGSGSGVNWSNMLGTGGNAIKFGTAVAGLAGLTGQNQYTNSQNTSIPAWAQPYYSDLFNRASQVSSLGLPTQLTPEQRVAGFNQDQQNVFTGLRGQQMPGQFGWATQGLGQAMNMAGNSGQYAPGQFNAPMTQAQQWGTAAMQQYMSPYQQGVTDIAKREAQRQADIQTANRGTQAAMGGAFGGDRQAILDAEAARNTERLLNDIQTQGLQSAYTTGMGQFNADQTNSLSSQFANQRAIQNAQQMGEQSRQYGAGLGLSAANTYGALANQMAGIGTAQQNAQLNLYNAQMNAGNVQQQNAQQMADVNYQNWMQQLGWPAQQLNTYSSVIHGINPGTSTTSTYQGPNQWSQAVGAGLTAAGLYNSIYGTAKS